MQETRTGEGCADRGRIEANKWRQEWLTKARWEEHRIKSKEGD